MRLTSSQNRKNVLEQVAQLGNYILCMLSEFNIRNSPLITEIVHLLQYIAKFCDDIKFEKHIQEDNSEIIAAIRNITYLVKKQSSNIKAIKHSSLKSQVENTMSYKDALTYSPSLKLEPTLFKVNKVMLKINN